MQEQSKPRKEITDWAFGIRPGTRKCCLTGKVDGQEIWSSRVHSYNKNQVETNNTIYDLVGPADEAFKKQLKKDKVSIKEYVASLFASEV